MNEIVLSQAEQIAAANVGTVFLVPALDENFHLRRTARSLAVDWESGAQPARRASASRH